MSLFEARVDALQLLFFIDNALLTAAAKQLRALTADDATFEAAHSEIVRFRKERVVAMESLRKLQEKEALVELDG